MIVVSNSGVAGSGSATLSIGDAFHTGGAIVMVAADAAVSCDRFYNIGGGQGFQWSATAGVGGDQYAFFLGRFDPARPTADYTPTFTSANSSPILWAYHAWLFDAADAAANGGNGLRMEFRDGYSKPTISSFPTDDLADSANGNSGPYASAGVVLEHPSSDPSATADSPLVDELSEHISTATVYDGSNFVTGHRRIYLAHYDAWSGHALPYTMSVDGTYTNGSAAGLYTRMRTEDVGAPAEQTRRWWVGVAGWG